jgi:hypothetical protein
VDPTGYISKNVYWWGSTYTLTSAERSALVKVLGYVNASEGVIAAGGAILIFGLSVATAGVIAAFSFLAATIAGAGAWNFTYYSSIPITGRW